MKKKVLKFGGTSVGSIERIMHAAKIIKKEHDLGNKIIVVVSAMAGKTNELISLSKSVSNNFTKRELDVLLSTGEQVSCALITGALNELGLKAKSFMNWQIPILTEGESYNARIINMSITKVDDYLSNSGIAVIPGYQGISSLGEITTIGRGGSDATAVAIAKIFDTDNCEIYTDVDGVYSTDPNKIPVAKKIDKISYEEMLEMASLGAKVMQPIAVQASMVDDIQVHVRSTFSEKSGTKIISEKNSTVSVGKATQEHPRLKETHIIHYSRKGLETKIVPGKVNGFCRKKQPKKHAWSLHSRTQQTTNERTAYGFWICWVKI